MLQSSRQTDDCPFSPVVPNPGDGGNPHSPRKPGDRDAVPIPRGRSRPAPIGPARSRLSVGGTDHRARGESAQHSALAPAGPPSRSERTFLGLAAPEPRGAAGPRRACGWGSRGSAPRARVRRRAGRLRCAPGRGSLSSPPPRRLRILRLRSAQPAPRPVHAEPPARGPTRDGRPPARCSPREALAAPGCAAPASAFAARYGRGAAETRRTEPGPRVRRGCGPERSAERQGQGRRGRGPAPCVVWLRPGGEVGGCVRASFALESPILESLPGAGPRRGEARTGGCPPQPGATDSSPSPACRPAWRTGAPRPRVPLSASRPPPRFTNRWGS